MKKIGLVFAAALSVAIVAAAPHADAQQVHYIGAGSSAMFQGFGVAAVNDLGNAIATGTAAAPYNYCASGSGNTCTVNHWSVKTSTGTNLAGLQDSRNASIPVEYGNIWVAWVNCSGPTCPSYTGANGATEVWTYLSVDSAVGVRNFLGRNSTGQPSSLVLASADTSTPGVNVISQHLFVAPWNGSEATEAGLQSDVYSALNGASQTAGMTDIRPEDALYATYRILGDCPAAGCGNPPPTPPSNPCPQSDVGVPGVAAPVCATTSFAHPYFYSFSLGYGGFPGPGSQILEAAVPGGATGSAKATPVGFALPGFKDPFTGSTVPSTINVYPVGETPIVLIANRSNAKGLGQIIGSFPKCSSGGPWTTVCTYNAAFTSDGSYYVRNVWDQSPYPPVANTFPWTGPLTVGYCATNPSSAYCHITRRPLGNLYAGNLCEGRNTAFSWPEDPAFVGARTTVPNGTDFPVNLIQREPLSGTYNTFEFDEVRRFGGTGGNQTKNGSSLYGKPPYISEEENAQISAGTNYNPLQSQCTAGYADTDIEGKRYRAVGTGDLVSDVKATADTIGYTFFSFGNVSSIASSPSYGYLMIDGIDPLFADYENNAGNPGQPASPSAPLTWGELPACTPGGTPDCTRSAIWAGGNYYPNLVNGTYPAWSEVRMMCDTATAHCLTTSDALGAEALVQNLQWDIHNQNFGGVPDLLPFSDAATGGLSFNPPYGDVGYIRDHFSYLAADDTQNYNNTGVYSNSQQQTTRQALFTPGGFGEPAVNCGGKVGVNGPPSSECGGDAGGFILPVGTANQGGKMQ